MSGKENEMERKKKWLRVRKVDDKESKRMEGGRKRGGQRKEKRRGEGMERRREEESGEVMERRREEERGEGMERGPS